MAAKLFVLLAALATAQAAVIAGPAYGAYPYGAYGGYHGLAGPAYSGLAAPVVTKTLGTPVYAPYANHGYVAPAGYGGPVYAGPAYAGPAYAGPVYSTPVVTKTVTPGTAYNTHPADIAASFVKAATPFFGIGSSHTSPAVTTTTYSTGPIPYSHAPIVRHGIGYSPAAVVSHGAYGW